MSFREFEGFPIIHTKINKDVIINIIKYLDLRLLEEIPGVDTSIHIHNGCEFELRYNYDNKEISVIISSAYIMVNSSYGCTMMYENDGEEIPVRNRLFNTVMSLINTIISK